MHGFLNIHKAAGMTSHDVVARVRRLVGRKVKVGHAGTLDPAATGVLPVAIGQATRLIEYLADARKGYRATVALGITTSTDDAEGELLTCQPVPALDQATLEAALEPLRGSILQVPPMYAALHHNGQRLYDLARAGQIVERAPRPVTIYQLELLAWNPATGQLTLEIACSKGTYIRALARDLGVALGCGAHLAALQRTFVGDFGLATAVPLEVLQAAESPHPYLLAPDVAVADWPALTLNAAQVQQVLHGKMLHLPIGTPDQVRVHTPPPQSHLLALLQRDPDPPCWWKPLKVLAEIAVPPQAG